MTHSTWNNSVQYFSGGPLCIRNANAWSNILNSYTEGFQPPISLNPRSKVDGGTNAAGVEGGSFHNIVYDYEYIQSSGVVIPNSPKRQGWLTLGNNTVDYVAPLKVFNNPDLSGTPTTAFFETTRVGNYIGIKNSTSSGGIAYNFEDFNFYTNGFLTMIAQINPTGISPAADNVRDLGLANMRWKKIFSYDGNFSSSLAVGTSSPHISSLLDLTSTSKGLLLPRLTKAQRNLINNPAEGLMIYQTDNTAGLRVFNGTNWVKFAESVD